jgi:hypothetical protein
MVETISVSASACGCELATDSRLASPDLTLEQVRTLVEQIRSMAGYVSTGREAAALVRKASATEKLVGEMLKACVVMEGEQFALRQAAAEAHLRTQRRAGELLSELVKNPGGRLPKSSSPDASRPASLRELGIASHESHRWQRIAQLPADQFEQYVSECRERRRELTIAGALALANRHARDRDELMDMDADVKLSDGSALLEEYHKASPQIAKVIWLEPVTLASAVPAQQRTEMMEELCRFQLWIRELMSALRALDSGAH